MKRDNLKFHVCPQCRAEDLHFSDDREEVDDEVLTGYLCCKSCGMRFEIARGVPRFVSLDNYAKSFGFQWNHFSKTQLDSYSGVGISKRRILETTRWPSDMTGIVILEAGSGAGRFTEVMLDAGAFVVSCDYSTAVDANFNNNGRHRNLHLFQGDIFNLPLKPLFDKVLCVGVLQHTPDPERAFISLTKQVRPGGELVVDIYPRRLDMFLHWKYLLRPLTRHLPKAWLFRVLEAVVPAFIPLARSLRKIGGRAGARLVPIIEYSHLGLPTRLNEQWALLDTFDMYSPMHDHPQTQDALRRWYVDCGFQDVQVHNGPNGIVGRGVRPDMTR